MLLYRRPALDRAGDALVLRYPVVNGDRQFRVLENPVLAYRRRNLPVVFDRPYLAADLSGIVPKLVGCGESVYAS